ncbi:hypothetical protein BpKM390_51360 [Burkholderia pseudomallei]|nr:hypothetical protein GTC019_49060 [Burkholderia pseudomallei]BEH27777.1 hypothetical protein GTC050_50290 [Burkholderia pseudomallei]BEH33805.1 hypothetical protein GTC054_50210 [Burkholderia pseudomallei]BEH39780.1 hypothetical protein GTC254T_48750 [Burkholderia pseudomallei]BEH45751.1 hypothetical protein KNG_49520 [Burkholderia pseudomallei]
MSLTSPTKFWTIGAAAATAPAAVATPAGAAAKAGVKYARTASRAAVWGKTLTKLRAATAPTFLIPFFSMLKAACPTPSLALARLTRSPSPPGSTPWLVRDGALLASGSTRSAEPPSCKDPVFSKRPSGTCSVFRVDGRCTSAVESAFNSGADLALN